MTKDGVRDFIAAEYTLSENYVHGLAAFGPRLKKFRKPAFLPGLKPRAFCGKFCERRKPLKVIRPGGSAQYFHKYRKEKLYGARYWFRTSDPRRVKAMLYH